MSIISRWFQLVKKQYEKERDGTGLAVFRIVFCFVMLVEIAQLFYFRHLVFDLIPYVKPYEIDFTIPLILWMACLCMLITGLFTRASAIANYIFCLIFLSTMKTYEYHMHYVYTGVSFLFMFLPVSRCLSLDRLRLKWKYSHTRFLYQPPTTVSALAYSVLIIVGIAFVYFDSTLYKLASPMWLKGLGVWAPSSVVFASWVNSSALLNMKYVALFLGYLVLVFEVAFIFLFPFKRFAQLLIILGLALHLGILVQYPIPLFAIGFASLYILMFPPSVWSKLFTRRAGNPKVSCYYDAECPLCLRTRILMEHFDVRGNIIFKTVQADAAADSALKDIGMEQLLSDIHCVDAHSKVYTGVDAYIKMLSAIWYLKPVAWFMRIPGIYQLAKRIYAHIAANRATERCTEDNCGYTPRALPKDDRSVKILHNLSLHDAKIWGAFTGIVMLFVLQFCSSYNSLLVRNIRHFSGIDRTKAGQCVYKIMSLPTPIGHYLLGITPHGVFMDHHFHKYVTEIAIVYSDGIHEEWLPVIDANGQPGLYLTGSYWVKWNFAVMYKMDQQRIERGIRNFSAFWATKHNKDLNNAVFKIKMKRLPEPNEWEKDFLNKEIALPWTDAGYVSWNNKVFTPHLTALADSGALKITAH